MLLVRVGSLWFGTFETNIKNYGPASIHLVLSKIYEGKGVCLIKNIFTLLKFSLHISVDSIKQ